METISHQESAATTTDSKETKPDQQERDRCTIVAGQRDGSKVSPLLSSQNLSKRALVDSLSSGCCFDEGELDYDESMEGDRERAAISAAGCCEEAGSVATREVEEGEVTSDEEGEVKDSNDGNGNQVVSTTKQGGPSRTRQLPSLEESGHIRSEYRKRATGDGQEDLTCAKAETTHPAVCRHFIQGKCSWGLGCRFLHHDPTEEPPNLRDFPFNHGPFSSHFPTDVAAHPEYLPPLGRGHPHKVFQRPMGMDAMCPPFLPVPEPLPLPVYRDPTLVYHGGAGPRSKWGPMSTFPPEVGKLKTSDVEEESEGWHRLRTVTRKWGSEDDHTHTIPSDKPKQHKKEQRDSDSGAEMVSSPEQAKPPTPSINSEVWTDPWARQGPSSSHTKDKKQKGRGLNNPSGCYRGDALVEAESKKRQGQDLSPVPRQGVEETKRLREGHGEEEEEKDDIKEKRSIKKHSPGEEEGVGQTRKRSLDDNSTANVEEKSARKRARKEGRAPNRNKKLSGDSPLRKEEEKHLSSHPPRDPGHFPPKGSGRGPPTFHRVVGSSKPAERKRQQQVQRGGGRSWRPELPAAPQRGSSGDEGRSPTPVPSDSSSESDSGPEGVVEEEEAIHKSKQPKELHHPKDDERNAITLKPVVEEDPKGRSREAKLLEELNAINREIDKKRTQATRV